MVEQEREEDAQRNLTRSHEPGQKRSCSLEAQEPGTPVKRGKQPGGKESHGFQPAVQPKTKDLALFNSIRQCVEARGPYVHWREKAEIAIMELHLWYAKSGDPMNYYRDSNLKWCHANYRAQLSEDEFYRANQWMKWMDALSAEEFYHASLQLT